MPPPGTLSKEPNPYRGQQETRPCVLCGTPVTRYLSALTIDRPWACSKTCNMKVRLRGEILEGVWKQPKKQRRGDTVPCTVCGTEFYRSPAYIKQGRHLCSIACNQKWQARNQIKKICPQCTKEFGVAVSESSMQYCSRACQVASRILRPTGRQHNGRPVLINHQGYCTVYEPEHPAANISGRILEHRLVMEKKLGRRLTRKEHVHHINHIKTDNSEENLTILDPVEHQNETVAYTQQRHRTTEERLAEYERRFGPLT